MKSTQLQLCESARRKVARHYGAVNEMMGSPNRPTVTELKKLKAKNPRVWGIYPDSAAKPD